MSRGWTIRPVRPDDAPALRRMREEAGWDLEKVPEWISASLSGKRPTWVAEVNGETVGMVSLELSDPNPEVANGKEVAAVTSLSVLASAGRRGLGRALTVFAEEEARARGVRVLTLNTRPTNAVALALYEGLGYRRWKEQERPWGRAVLSERPSPPGEHRGTAHYLVPIQLQCEQCHSESGAVAPIGPKARLLNIDQAYAGGTENQLALDAERDPHRCAGAGERAEAPRRLRPGCGDSGAACPGVPRV